MSFSHHFEGIPHGFTPCSNREGCSSSSNPGDTSLLSRRPFTQLATTTSYLLLTNRYLQTYITTTTTWLAGIILLAGNDTDLRA